MHVTCVFFFYHGASSRQQVLFQSKENSYRNSQRCETICGNEAFSYACLQVVENFQSDMRTLKGIQEVDGHQLLKIHKQLPEFMNS